MRAQVARRERATTGFDCDADMDYSTTRKDSRARLKVVRTRARRSSKAVVGGLARPPGEGRKRTDRRSRPCVGDRFADIHTTPSSPSGSLARFAKLRVGSKVWSGCALARGFLVSAPPVSASWKPFPGAESRDRLATVGDPVRKNSARVRVARVRMPQTLVAAR